MFLSRFIESRSFDAVSPWKTPSRPPTSRPLRLFYAAGPGDVIHTYRHWKMGEDDPSEPVVAYSHQFYDLCRDEGIEAYVWSTCSRRDTLRDGRLRIEHRPNRWRTSGGLRFHLGQLLHGMRMVGSALRFGADVAFVNEGTHWFLLTPLVLAGVRVVPSLHVRITPPGRRRGWGQRVISKLNGWFFRHGCSAILVASRDITGDLGDRVVDRVPVVQFLPLYRRSTFAGIPPARHEQRPFNVLYVGRVEVNKGVFDFLEVARRICRDHDDVRFHVCGIGSALEAMRECIATAGLASRVLLHGNCDRDRLSRMYGESHVVMVPTRSEIAEGFNQVTAEAVLAGRPVITSSLCPAAACVEDAVIQVPPDDVEAYANALNDLVVDSPHYRQMQQACAVAQKQFYDPGRSWGAAVRQVLAAISVPCAA